MVLPLLEIFSHESAIAVISTLLFVDLFTSVDPECCVDGAAAAAANNPFVLCRKFFP